MNKVTHDITADTESTSSLPLQADKQPTFKIIGIMALLILVVAANYFIFSKPEPTPIEKKESETYDLSYANPISMTNAVINTKPDLKSDIDAKLARDVERELQEAKAKDFIERLQAPQNGAGGSSAYSSGIAGTPQPNNSQNDSQNGLGEARITDPNTAFLLQASNTKAQHVYATHYGALPYVIGQGKFIFANLAVAINSDLPGQITATVSQDVYGDQGRKILIPKGSLLIGEYKSGLVNNQSRLFVVWTRVREPNGIDVMLGSEGADSLGRAGLTGSVDQHFFARFGSAFLMAVIGAGASTVGVNPNDEYNSAAAYRQSVTQAMAQQANNNLNQNINIPPTINIAQGQKIVVFVNRDLDFSRVIR